MYFWQLCFSISATKGLPTGMSYIPSDSTHIYRATIMELMTAMPNQPGHMHMQARILTTAAVAAAAAAAAATLLSAAVVLHPHSSAIAICSGCMIECVGWPIRGP